MSIRRDTPGISGGDAAIRADAKDVIADIVKNPDKPASHDVFDNIAVGMEVDASAKPKRPAPSETSLAFDHITPPGAPRKVVRTSLSGSPSESFPATIP